MSACALTAPASSARSRAAGEVGGGGGSHRSEAGGGHGESGRRRGGGAGLRAEARARRPRRSGQRPGPGRTHSAPSLRCVSTSVAPAATETRSRVPPLLRRFSV
nr:serine/arginine-rich splicing factor RSZ22-like [Lolium perenne]